MEMNRYTIKCPYCNLYVGHSENILNEHKSAYRKCMGSGMNIISIPIVKQWIKNEQERKLMENERF